jgi:HD-GYP domain-containing protein (c-di-GMP phosphodiesterase class II)
MIKVPIDYVQEGDIVSKTQTFINYTSGMNQQVDVKKGVKLTNNMINKLKTVYNAEYIYIEDKDNNLTDEDTELYSKVAKQKTIDKLNEAVGQLENKGFIDLKSLKNVVNNIIELVLDAMKDNSSGKQLLPSLLHEVDTHDSYTWEHSINVTIYGIMLAYLIPDSKYFNKDKYELLAYNLLLHDIGKLKIPLEILNKESKLNDKEFETIQKHPYYGFHMLRKINDENIKNNLHTIPMTYGIASLQHHQYYNGKGYPFLKKDGEIRKLKGREISLFARICSVADIYDALTTSRPYRKPLHPATALDILISKSGEELDPTLVNLFSFNINPFPLGNTVKLSTGELGLIVGYHDNNKFEPIIQPYMKKVFRNGKYETIKLFNVSPIPINYNSSVQIIINNQKYETKLDK